LSPHHHLVTEAVARAERPAAARVERPAAGAPPLGREEQPLVFRSQPNSSALFVNQPVVNQPVVKQHGP
jgi:hypothetical protein